MLILSVGDHRLLVVSSLTLCTAWRIVESRCIYREVVGRSLLLVCPSADHNSRSIHDRNLHSSPSCIHVFGSSLLELEVHLSLAYDGVVLLGAGILGALFFHHLLFFLLLLRICLYFWDADIYHDHCLFFRIWIHDDRLVAAPSCIHL